ncbi:hypothetical protein [Paraburkholderia aromaticivorans]|uniref:hypothetical protein n=1 Tax=Paraburkholderia aromaticivorans TaxID=2026199 RepID=UPI0014561221|nr:hypothetical protein [Paraburkholderia aromaticivorans]
MYQIDGSTAATSKPASTALGTVGYFTDGNPATGVPATIVPAEFFNSVMLELMNAITGAGLPLSKSTTNQLYTAIQTIAQGGGANYALDTGTANTYAATYAPTIAAPGDGMVRAFKVKTANTGASTFALDGSATTYPIYGLAGSALQGGEMPANGIAVIRFNSTLVGWVLYHCSKGALQVPPAIASQHAVQFGQVAAIAGTARNLAALLTAQGTTATWTADELLIKTALGGLSFLFNGVSVPVNLSVSGIGGVVGTTPAASGFAAIYAATGPSVSLKAFATDATATKAQEVYTGTLPPGYTASQLIGIAPISATVGQFAPFAQTDRRVDWAGGNVLTGSTFVGGPTARTSTSIPLNARFVGGFNQIGNSAASAMSQTLASTGINNMGGQYCTYNIAAGTSIAIPFRVAVTAPQTIYQQTTNSAGTPGFTISVNSFDF